MACYCKNRKLSKKDMSFYYSTFVYSHEGLFIFVYHILRIFKALTNVNHDNLELIN